MTTAAVSDLKSQNEQMSVLTIEQLNLTIKQLLEGEISQVWVKGEISNFKAHSSGHFYFSLKDSKSQISAVMFRGMNSRLKFKPVDGMEVIVRGRVSVYEPRGTYQILCDMMEPVGAGALQRAFEQLKQKLKAEGLFEAARKRPIPQFPQHVAIVTSPTGAAIRDILNILSRRAPHVQVTLVPAVVQGEAAVPSLCEGFLKAQKLPDTDVIIIGRGGGSIEDLWAFNDEGLARMIAASPIPVISAVGHEIDFTIADFVADLRAPTPSAAAELVAQSHSETLNRLQQLARRLTLSWQRSFGLATERLSHLSRLLVDPKKRIQDLILRNDDLTDRLSLAVQNLFRDRRYRVELLTQQLKSPYHVIQEKQAAHQVLLLRFTQAWKDHFQKKAFRLQNQMQVLNSLSPLNVVERGYSLVLKEDKVISHYQDLKREDVLTLVLTEGQAQVKVMSVTKENTWTSKKN